MVRVSRVSRVRVRVRNRVRVRVRVRVTTLAIAALGYSGPSPSAARLLRYAVRAAALIQGVFVCINCESVYTHG